MFQIYLLKAAAAAIVMAASLTSPVPQDAAPEHAPPAHTETIPAASQTHVHALDAKEGVDEETVSPAGLAWRYVTHYGCGWTASYLVYVPGYTYLVCNGCWRSFTVYFRC